MSVLLYVHLSVDTPVHLSIRKFDGPTITPPDGLTIGYDNLLHVNAISGVTKEEFQR